MSFSRWIASSLVVLFVPLHGQAQGYDTAIDMSTVPLASEAVTSVAADASLGCPEIESEFRTYVVTQMDDVKQIYSSWNICAKSTYTATLNGQKCGSIKAGLLKSVKSFRDEWKALYQKLATSWVKNNVPAPLDKVCFLNSQNRITLDDDVRNLKPNLHARSSSSKDYATCLLYLTRWSGDRNTLLLDAQNGNKLKILSPVEQTKLFYLSSDPLARYVSEDARFRQSYTDAQISAEFPKITDELKSNVEQRQKEVSAWNSKQLENLYAFNQTAQFFERSLSETPSKLALFQRCRREASGLNQCLGVGASASAQYSALQAERCEKKIGKTVGMTLLGAIPALSFIPILQANGEIRRAEQDQISGLISRDEAISRKAAAGAQIASSIVATVGGTAIGVSAKVAARAAALDGAMMTRQMAASREGPNALKGLTQAEKQPLLYRQMSTFAKTSYDNTIFGRPLTPTEAVQIERIHQMGGPNEGLFAYSQQTLRAKQVALEKLGIPRSKAVEMIRLGRVGTAQGDVPLNVILGGGGDDSVGLGKILSGAGKDYTDSTGFHQACDNMFLSGTRLSGRDELLGRVYSARNLSSRNYLYQSGEFVPQQASVDDKNFNLLLRTLTNTRKTNDAALTETYRVLQQEIDVLNTPLANGARATDTGVRQAMSVNGRLVTVDVGGINSARLSNLQATRDLILKIFKTRGLPPP
jgi:hypothetical protein